MSVPGTGLVTSRHARIAAGRRGWWTKHCSKLGSVEASSETGSRQQPRVERGYAVVAQRNILPHQPSHLTKAQSGAPRERMHRDRRHCQSRQRRACCVPRLPSWQKQVISAADCCVKDMGVGGSGAQASASGGLASVPSSAHVRAPACAVSALVLAKQAGPNERMADGQRSFKRWQRQPTTAGSGTHMAADGAQTASLQVASSPA